MKKNYLLRLFSLILLFIITPLTPVFGQVNAPTFNKDIKIYDYAQLFTEKEKNNLSQIAQNIANNGQIDIVVVTTNKPNGKTSMAYADDFYDAYPFGYGEDRSGLIMLINMKDREVWISTTGRAIDIFTDKKINSILDSVYIDLGQQQYFEASKQFLELSEAHIQQWSKQSFLPADIQDKTPEQTITDQGKEIVAPIPTSNKPTTVFEKLSGSFKFGAQMGGVIIILLTLWNRQKMSQAPNVQTYLDEKGFLITLRTDNLVDSQVTRTEIPKETESKSFVTGASKNQSTHHSSTTHQSSNGHTHGGAGRKF